MTHHRSSRGFTLAETLIATGLLVTAMAGLAQLLVMSVRFTRDSAQSGMALAVAQDKLEFLRALSFGYDPGGAPVTDPRLQPSPVLTLTEDVAGFVDWLDPAGQVLADPAGADYVRRWRVMEVAADDPEAIAIEVCVFDSRSSARRLSDADACLATARVRQP